MLLSYEKPTVIKNVRINYHFLLQFFSYTMYYLFITLMVLLPVIVCNRTRYSPGERCDPSNDTLKWCPLSPFPLLSTARVAPATFVNTNEYEPVTGSVKLTFVLPEN